MATHRWPARVAENSGIGDVLSEYAFVGHVSGFDVSPFGALAAQRLPVHGTMTSWRRLSRDIDLLRIDLSAKEHVAEIRKLPIPVLKDGVAVGIVQWMNVDLADGVAFSDHPDDYSDGGWPRCCTPFRSRSRFARANHSTWVTTAAVSSRCQRRAPGQEERFYVGPPPEPGAKGAPSRTNRDSGPRR